jgi:hypothetical protein
VWLKLFAEDIAVSNSQDLEQSKEQPRDDI